MGFRQVAVVLAGGAGERFWPVSTPERPKQFLRLADPGQSLLAQSVTRAIALAGPEGAFVVTGSALAERTRAECPHLPPENVIEEPARRNTAPALAWFAAHLLSTGTDPGATSMIVLTADHRIDPEHKFLNAAQDALESAQASGWLGTFGIKPDRPETGYGYIELGETWRNGFRVKSFTEKPDEETATRYLDSAKYLWNSGMFVWTLGAFLAELQTASPELAEAITDMAQHFVAGDRRAAAERFGALESASIDLALMERAENVFVVPATFTWDDLGSWDALARSLRADAQGNVAVGSVRFVDCAGCIAYNDRTEGRLTLFGLSDQIVVATDQDTLSCPRSASQDIKWLQQ